MKDVSQRAADMIGLALAVVRRAAHDIASESEPAHVISEV